MNILKEKMNSLKVSLTIIILIVIGFGVATYLNGGNAKKVVDTITNNLNQDEDKGGPEGQEPHPLSIEALRKGEYPGSDITIEQTFAPGSNYQRYIASYKSEGLKIYALLTVPNGEKPKSGWPVIIFNHGYIQPEQYRTTERYVAYVDAFAKNGYIVFKPDCRGHGNSEGKAEGGYGSNAYTIDILNALSSMKRYKDADSRRIGMWGHSMGGGITLRAMVVSKDIKAGVIWAGVVGSYSDLLNNWRRRNWMPRSAPHWATSWRQSLIDQYGTPEQNPQFWNSISANSYVKDISGPIQLHHAQDDSHVPFVFSEKLNRELQETSQTVEFYTYEGDDHNLTNSFDTAVERSVDFFNKYVKGGEEN